MNALSVLGIDFGTTKTYLSKCPEEEPSPVSVDFGDGRDGIPSAILYRRGKAPLIGQTALDEYGEASYWERNTYRLATNFKADLARSEKARTAASDFLSALLAEARAQRLDMEPAGRRVLFGAPSESDEAFRAALEETAGRAGYGVPFLVDEPKGALLYHMKQRDISVDAALDGVLVVDFGGGTCDFAFLERGRVVHSWGDMLLGGRLFDDLFFQWLCDQNPGLEEELAARDAAYYVQTSLCRDVKEFFSRTMARDREESVSKVLRGYGRLTDMTWREFLRRGSEYSPSMTFADHAGETIPELRGRGGSSARSFLAAADGPMPGSEIDLFGWFRACLLAGLDQGGIARSRVSLVILAGGSSQWPFVRETLASEMPLEDRSIVRSERPYAVISLGISLMPALKRRFAAARRSLGDELEGFLQGPLSDLVTSMGERLDEKMTATALDVFFRQEVVPLLKQFREEGGRIALLQIRLDQRTAAAEPRAREHLARLATGFLEGLREGAEDLLADWFASHGISVPRRDLSLTLPEELSEPLLRVRTPAADGMLDVACAAVGGFLTAGAAILCGGTGAALISAGPVGLAVGALLGASAGWVLLRHGREHFREAAERIPLPPFAASILMSDKSIDRLEEDLARAIREHLQRRFVPLKRAMDDHIRNLVLEEIRALNEINSF